jgi:menaquinol-cytochrome c reductase iron-sulfur subunit
MNRRTAAGLLVTCGSFLAAGIVGIPTLIMGVSPALRRRRETWRSLGRLEDFPIGKVSQGTLTADRESWPPAFGERSVFVWRPSPEAAVVFSRSCTDLGCPLEYQAGSGCFFCPCHGGIFSQDGKRLAGPPKTPMHRYAQRIRAGELEVDITSVPPAA